MQQQIELNLNALLSNVVKLITLTIFYLKSYRNDTNFFHFYHDNLVRR